MTEYDALCKNCNDAKLNYISVLAKKTSEYNQELQDQIRDAYSLIVSAEKAYREYQVNHDQP